MKTLKTLIAALLIAFSFNAIAAMPDESSNKLSMDFAVKTYVDAISFGKIKGFANILDDDAKFTVSLGKKFLNYSKSEIIDFMKESEGVRQNCTTDYKIVDQGLSQAIVKVTMKYPNFSKVSFVTFANTSKGWKITNVSSAFN